MPLEPSPPSLFAGRLRWGVRGSTKDMVFSIRATTFKYALGLRPRAREDEMKAQKLAKQCWPALEAVAQAALATGHAVLDKGASKTWRPVYTIDDGSFDELFMQHRGRRG